MRRIWESPWLVEYLVGNTFLSSDIYIQHASDQVDGQRPLSQPACLRAVPFSSDYIGPIITRTDAHADSGGGLRFHALSPKFELAARVERKKAKPN